MTDWTTDSNDALTLSLVRAKKDQEVLGEKEAEEYQEFHPPFSYPIYGEDEKIYGYQDLFIDLRFTSGSLHQYVAVEYSAKLETTSTVDDVEGTLAKFIPPGYIKDEEAFLKLVEEEADTFKPMGQLIASYTRPAPNASSKGKGKSTAPADPEAHDIVEYEVYHATWDTPGFREYHRRMQIFILLYIEGGSYINEDEDTWEFVLSFEKRKRADPSQGTSYHFIGYTTLYPFYYFPEKVRLRLSQFVILSPFQRQGHGSELYRATYQYVMQNQNIAELTIEDPAEAFEDLRDKNDLQMLFKNEQFMKEAFAPETYGGGRVGGVGRAGKSGKGGESAKAKGKLGPPVDKMWAERWRKDLKMAQRQFQRLMEMLILSRLDPNDTTATRAYRLQVKERLYRFNFEILAQLEEKERYEKLEETYQNVREDYQRILARVC